MSDGEKDLRVILEHLLQAPAGAMTYATVLDDKSGSAVRYLVACWQPGSTSIEIFAVKADGATQLWARPEVAGGRVTAPVIEAIVEAIFLRASETGGNVSLASILQGQLETSPLRLSVLADAQGHVTFDVFRTTRLGGIEKRETFFPNKVPPGVDLN